MQLENAMDNEQGIERNESPTSNYYLQMVILRSAASDFADSLLDALVGGVDFYLTALDSEKGTTGLDAKVDFPSPFSPTCKYDLAASCLVTVF